MLCIGILSGLTASGCGLAAWGRGSLGGFGGGCLPREWRDMETGRLAGGAEPGVSTGKRTETSGGEETEGDTHYVKRRRGRNWEVREAT